MKKEYQSSTGVEVYIIYISLDHTPQSAILAILNKKEYLKDINFQIMRDLGNYCKKDRNKSNLVI